MKTTDFINKSVVFTIALLLAIFSLACKAESNNIRIDLTVPTNPEIINKVRQYSIPWIEVRELKLGESYSDRKGEKSFLNDTVLPDYSFCISDNDTTLEECLKTAYLNSPEIMRAAHEVQQYEAKLRQSLSLYIPEANIILLRSDAGIPALTDHYWNNSITGEISYLIYDSGKRSLLCKAAGDSLMAARYSFLQAWNEKAYKVSSAYYRLLYSYILMCICEDDLIKTRDNLQIAQGFYSTGSKAKIDVTQAEILVKTSEINLTESQASCLNAYTGLISEMGMDPNNYKIKKMKDLLTESAKPRQSIEQLRQEAELCNPMIGYYEYMNRAALNMASSYLTDRLPQFSANASWGGKTKWSANDTSWSVNFQLKIPLLKNTESKAYAEEQKALAMQALDAKEAVKIAAEEAARASAIQMAAAQKRSETAYSSVETALQNYRLSYLRYKSGVSTIIELNNAIDYLNNTRKLYLASLYDIRMSEAAIDKAIGSSIPDVSPEEFLKAIDEYIEKANQK